MQLIESIKHFNLHRHPALLQKKYEAMRSGIFRFYRGSCHLFYEDNHNENLLLHSPPVWLCGDLHLENFGTYKGDNRLLYFDINDFDEAILGPCLWDISRFVCSIIIAHHSFGLSKDEAVSIGNEVIQGYSNQLCAAHARMIESDSSTGIIGELLNELQLRKRKEFIRKRTEETKGGLKLKIDGMKTLVCESDVKKRVTKVVEDWAEINEQEEFFRVHDVAIRIAGTGSLGLERYVLLVEGKGTDNHYLMDIKVVQPSSLAKYSPNAQPAWENDAERVTEIQKRMQAVSPALLNSLLLDKKYFIMKELQPSQDKLDVTLLQSKLNKLHSSMQSFADIIAWDELRSSGRQGSATADELIAFAEDKSWQEPLIDFCVAYAHKVKMDYEIFCKAYDEGIFILEEDDSIIS